MINRDYNMTIDMAIRVLGGTQPIVLHSEYYYNQAIAIAINEMKKALPMKPINNGKWNAKTCPTCGEPLSEHKGDGYYTDMKSLSACPDCRQLLSWD